MPSLISPSMRIGVIMDALSTLHVTKDSTLAMLWAVQQREIPLYFFEMKDLSLKNGIAYGYARQLKLLHITHADQPWFELSEPQLMPLDQLDILLQRKDPPFDMEYIHATYILERAEEAGCLVVNRPQSLRDCNEKLFTSWFADCCPTTLVSRQRTQLKVFIQEQQDTIIKPLDGMGGASIFRVRADDPNLNVILETLTAFDQKLVMAQRYIPEVIDGDKRILLIDGEPIPYALARIPQAGETRANLAVGGRGEVRPLTARDRWICEQVKPALKARGLLFVGLDIIGDYLTEINVTSPTGIRQIDAAQQLDIGGLLIDCLLQKRSLITQRHTKDL